MAPTPDKLPRICLLSAVETSPSVLYGLVDVLGAAGVVYSEVTTGRPGEPIFDVRVVAATAEPFRCLSNILIVPDCAVNEADDADIVIVCDMYQPVDQPPRGKYTQEIDWLRRMHRRGALVTSVCSGALLLAEAGLLEDAEVASHWCYRDLFNRHYPRVTLRQELALCLDAEDRQIVTTGAVNAWQDLALYLIARFAGREHAVQTAKVFLLSEHEEGQLPFVVGLPPIGREDAVIADSQQWIAEHHAIHNPVACMAERAGLKLRTFSRRFRAATGYRPMEYVHLVRVEAAKRLLEMLGDKSVDDVGYVVGYEDPSSFRRLFRRRTGMTPAAYRRRFGGLGEGPRFRSFENNPKQVQSFF